MRNAQAHSTDAEAFERRLRAYAAGAGAVAAGLLASAPPAAAHIVVVPAHVSLGSSPFPISIEGTTEFSLVNTFNRTFYCVAANLSVTAVSGAGVVGHNSHYQQAGALRFGAVIGPEDHFVAGKQDLAGGASCRDFGWYVGGPFGNTKDRFLGLKFELNGQVYYGWAGFSVVYTSGSMAVLTAYAYETEPDKAIDAGQTTDVPTESRYLPANARALQTASAQPATLGVLALGSLGLNAWRKREAPEVAAEA